ncbi:uncharacterized protein LOC132791073 [Drosophila nasuta]|uniref:Uncharacterized protein LOC117563416 n=1 Tax=Drosophila albomicans TaxID=7291 RepID=A0A6P8XCZ4_DROAB|nr:uncharacterized protein LOC117563416 [Drosophila albomicans]XP_060655840.1 uncharacterized protein LOC132791073 [Drosophila nasuta]
MMLNPIEIFCYYVAQPVVDFLAYLLHDVHYLAFIVAVAMIGILLGLVMGVLSLICIKLQGEDQPVKKLEAKPPQEDQFVDSKQKHD